MIDQDNIEDSNEVSQSSEPDAGEAIPMLDRVFDPSTTDPSMDIESEEMPDWTHQLVDQIRDQLNPLIEQAVEESLAHLRENLADQLLVRIEEQIPKLIERSLREIRKQLPLDI